MAPNAALRPFQMRALCSAELLASTTFGSSVRAISTMSRSRRGDLVLGALDLDDEQRFDVERIAGLGEGLAHRDGRPVHVLDGDRDDARADDGGDALAGGLAGIEAEHHRPRAFGLRQDAQRRLGDDAELALRADDQRQEVVALGIEVRAADLDDLAVHHHHA